MKTPPLLVTALFSLFLNSCSSKYTADQRETLESIKVAPTTYTAETYKEPDLGDLIIDASITTPNGNDFIGALIGHDAKTSLSEIYTDTEKSQLAKLKASSPKFIADTVNVEIRKNLKENVFFADRIRSKSPNRLVTQIKKYTLVRNGEENNKPLMSPYIMADVKLLDSDGKAIGTGWIPIEGRSTLQYPMSDYTSNPDLLRKGYKEAARRLGAQFSEQLNNKTTK